jgi:hypothetical protein
METETLKRQQEKDKLQVQKEQEKANLTKEIDELKNSWLRYKKSWR